MCMRCHDCLKQIIRLVHVIATLGRTMNDCVHNLRQDQIMLMREFRKLNFSPEGTSIEISHRHRQFLDSIGLAPHHRRRSDHRGTPTASFLSISHDVPHTDAAVPETGGEDGASTARISLVKLCSLQNENAELTPFRLTEIGLVADALRDQSIQVFGVSITTGLVTTIVSLLVTNLATIVSKVL